MPAEQKNDSDFSSLFLNERVTDLKTDSTLTAVADSVLEKIEQFWQLGFKQVKKNV